MKQELLNQLKNKKLEEISDYLPGNDDILGYCGGINGHYTNGYHDSIQIINKEDLTLTFKIDKESFEQCEELFENTQQYEEGMELEDWNGEWKETLDNYSSTLFLVYLLLDGKY